MHEHNWLSYCKSHFGYAVPLRIICWQSKTSVRMEKDITACVGAVQYNIMHTWSFLLPIDFFDTLTLAFQMRWNTRIPFNSTKISLFYDSARDPFSPSNKNNISFHSQDFRILILLENIIKTQLIVKNCKHDNVNLLSR